LIIVVVAALLGTGWFWRRSFRRGEQLADPDRLFAAILAIGLLCRVAFVFLTPAFDAPDERAHFNYIKYLAEHASLPVQTHGMDTMYEWEFSQPPLYYMLMTPLFLVGKVIFGGEMGAFFLARLGSVLLWLVNVGLGFALLKRLEIADALVRNFVLAMVCLLPTYTFISAVVNNDNLLATIGTAILILMLERGRSVESSLKLGFLLGLALLTKQSAIVFAPIVTFLIVVDAFKGWLKWSSALLHLLLVLGPALVLYLPWVLRNWYLYHVLMPESLSVGRLVWRSKLIGLGSCLHNLIKSFWAVSGFSNNISYPFPIGGFIFLWLCLIWHERDQHESAGTERGCPSRSTENGIEPRKTNGAGAEIAHAAAGTAALRAQRPDFLNRRVNGPFLAACLFGLALNILLVLRLGYLFGMGQGRHLFPLLYPLALLLAARWRTFPAKRLEPYTTALWIIYALTFLIFSVWMFPIVGTLPN
jgi:hypothetical protein